MDEPQVDIELAKDDVRDVAGLARPGLGAHRRVPPRHRPRLGRRARPQLGRRHGHAVVDGRQRAERDHDDQHPDSAQQTNRRVFLSPRLKTDLRISGTPVIDIEASVNETQTNLGALLVDYGADTQVSRTGDGIAERHAVAERDCWGESSATDNACYVEGVQARDDRRTSWRVTKGILDTSNRDSLLATAATPITVDQKYRFRWPTFPHDYVFKAGHQIGLVLIADYTPFSSVAGTGQGTTVTLDTKTSKMQLPIVGGATAAAASGAFVADTEAPEFNQTVLAVELDERRRSHRRLPAVADHRQPGPVADRELHAAERLDVRDRHDEGHCTATDANGNTSTGTFDVVVSFIDEDDGDVEGEVPATLNLAVGNAAAFAPSRRASPATTSTTMSATVTSTAADARLTVSDPQRNRDRPPGQRRVRAAAGAAGQRLERRRRGRRLRGDRRLGGADAAARVRGPGQQRLGDDRLQAVDRRERRAPHRHLRQDADVHALHDVAVT